ncbi:MAG: glycosyltransferase family 4 protein [Acidobacteriota bacterium]
MKFARVGLVCEGNAAISETAFSGTAKRMFLSLQNEGHEVIPVDASLSGPARAIAAAVSFSTNRAQWRSRFRYGLSTASYRTAAAERSLGSRPVDILLQVGASYDPPSAGSVPFAFYADWNMALSKGDSAASRHGLSPSEYDSIAAHHAELYRRAAAVFTISERLRQSFIDLYDLDPNRVHTTYAGPNFDLELIDRAIATPRTSTAPTVLFIAKEFRRKGGDLVAAAFDRLLHSVPNARLLFAGAAELPRELAPLKNVEHLGLLDKNNPAQLERLLQAYRNADVLVLPSRQDPFPTVIREAMFFGIPCIASDIWAMREMIVDGETGFLVPSEDSEALAHRLTLLLTDPGLCKRLGQAARQRAQTLFTWNSVGQALHNGIQQAIEDPQP